MNKQKHIGLLLPNAADKDYILDKIMENSYLLNYFDLSTLKGALYSSKTINQYIREELRHDHFLIKTHENSSLLSMSSGQQRKAFLNFLLTQKPQYLVLDNVYSNIDRETQITIVRQLEELSKYTLLIQLFYRKTDLLSIINRVLLISQENEILQEQDAQSFRLSGNTHKNTLPEISLPKLYNEKHININPLVQLNSISVAYENKKVLHNINWIIKCGEFWQLTGANGSGKTTILSIITGDNPRGYGQDMILFGRRKGSGETIWDIRQQIGYFTPLMLQQFSYNDTLENMIISGLKDSVGLYVKPKDSDRIIARNWLQMMGIYQVNKSFHSISPGQQRMVMVARAMVKQPPLLILDEPTVDLDDENSDLFIAMVRALTIERKVAILYVSHREESNLKPDKIFELIPGEYGYTGIIR